jgi:mono/diheme cytochrome c family protein
MSSAFFPRALVPSLIAGLALTAGLAFAADPPAKPAAPPAGNAAAAKSTFTSKCSACHKADGSGGVKLTGNATPNWKDPKTWADPKRKDADAYLRDCITNGKLPSGMVAWGKTGQLKPQEIENLIAYIHLLAAHK